MWPTNKRIALLSTFAVILGVSSAADAAPPRFIALGDLSGGDTFSVARDVSADGSKVVGLSKSGALPAGEAFVWTAGTGMTGLGSLSSFAPFSDASAISADGAWIVGTTRSPSSAPK